MPIRLRFKHVPIILNKSDILLYLLSIFDSSKIVD